RANAAVYWVASDDGTVPVTENQQTNGGVWQSLGKFRFQSGKNDGVTLTDSSTGVVVADALRWVGPVAAPSVATPAPAARPPSPTPTLTVDPGGIWSVTLQATDLHAGPDAATDTLASLPQFSYLQIVGYRDDWAYVYNPRARGTAYAPSSLL